jgi:integrase
MPKPTKKACLVKRGNMFHAKWRDPDGKQRMRSLRTSKEREARRALREIELILEDEESVHVVIQDKPQRENPTIEEFWDWYLPWLQTNRRARTVECYSAWWKQFIRLIRPERLGDVTKADIERFIHHKLEQGVKKSTVNSALTELQTIYNMAIKYGRYDGENPFKSIDKFKIPKNPHDKYLDAADVDRLVQAAADYCSKDPARRQEVDGRNIHLAMGLMAYAGLRRAEVCFAEWRWIDLRERTLTVQSGDEFEVKDNDYRVVPISDKLMAILEMYRADSGYLLASDRPREKRWRYRSDYRKPFRKCCEDADLIDADGNSLATPHMLRHSFAVSLAKNGVALAKIAAWLGHSFTSVTEIYARFQTVYDEDINKI